MIEKYDCSFVWFWLVSIVGLVAAGILYNSYGVMASFRKSIAIDGL